MILEISINPEKQLAIKAGDMVDFSTPLYKSKEKSQERIEVAELLSIHPKKIFLHLKKSVGDSIVLGDLLAEKKSFFSDKKVTSHIEGVITEIDHIEGVVLIETQKELFSEKCWFSGHVVEVSKKIVHIKIGKHVSLGTKYVEKDFGGLIWPFSDLSFPTPDYPVGIAEQASEYEVAKLEALGGQGLITLLKYEGDTLLPKAQLKEKESLKEIASKQFSCCFTQAQHSTIILYSL